MGKAIISLFISSSSDPMEPSLHLIMVSMMGRRARDWKCRWPIVPMLLSYRPVGTAL
jgi:hypothetical protein